MLNDSLKSTGTLKLQLIDADGNITKQHEHNLVVNTGLAYISSRMFGTTEPVMSHMAVGTGTSTAGAANAALDSQIARVALDSTNIVTTAVTNDSIQYVAIFSPGTGTGAITEAGIFNNNAGGTMLCRTVFAVINKGALDTLVITWKIQVQ
jgi:hypothetical protein